MKAVCETNDEKGVLGALIDNSLLHTLYSIAIKVAPDVLPKHMVNSANSFPIDTFVSDAKQTNYTRSIDEAVEADVVRRCHEHKLDEKGQFAMMFACIVTSVKAHADEFLGFTRYLCEKHDLQIMDAMCLKIYMESKPRKIDKLAPLFAHGLYVMYGYRMTILNPDYNVKFIVLNPAIPLNEFISGLKVPTETHKKLIVNVMTSALYKALVRYIRREFGKPLNDTAFDEKMHELDVIAMISMHVIGIDFKQIPGYDIGFGVEKGDIINQIRKRLIESDDLVEIVNATLKNKNLKDTAREILPELRKHIELFIEPLSKHAL